MPVQRRGLGSELQEPVFGLGERFGGPCFMLFTPAGLETLNP